MAKHDHLKRYRIWTNAAGETVKSRGRLSDEERKARIKAGGVVVWDDAPIEEDNKPAVTKEPVKKKELKTKPNTRPVFVKKVADPRKFVQGAEEAIKGLTEAAKNSINEKEKDVINGLIHILRTQMMPKYLEQIKLGRFSLDQ